MNTVAAALLALTCLPLAGCPSPAPKETLVPPESGIALNQEFTLRIGQEAGVNGVRVRFDAVTEDSRCPTSVNCAWAGQSKIRLSVGQDSGAVSVELSDNPATNARTANVGAYRIEFVRLDPTRVTPETLPPDVYRAILRVRKPDRTPGAGQRR